MSISMIDGHDDGMMRGDLISRSELISHFEEAIKWLESLANSFEISEEKNLAKREKCALTDALRKLQEAPAVDAVEVVRCKDCKYWKKGDFRAGEDVSNLEYGGRCPIARFARYESDFCSYGERRDGE